MYVVCFFNLRLGWVLSGLVVPGYLVPLILIKPWAAAVVVMEGVLTYFLVWFVSEYLSRWAQWCNFFGRDRFFALVLSSITVRLVFDGWLLPHFGEWATDHWHIAFDYRNNLHSFGLVIVSLIANQFWKTGFLKGLPPFVLTLALTLVITRYGLMALTNFNLSSVSYLYEDMATSILASPKAYIILVSTAFLASRMNLYYGWDYNGILIPSLLALQWYQPIKILATLGESCIILGLATLLLKTPPFNKMTIEGARKLLLFFNISFFYKLILGYVLVLAFPELKVTDYFGFGYLLSTLMAVKIHDKAIFARLTRATLQTSLTAVIAANMLGFALTLLPFSKVFENYEESATHRKPLAAAEPLSLAVLLQQEQVELYQAKLLEKFVPPVNADLEAFAAALEDLQAYLQHHDPIRLQNAAMHLAKVNYRLEQVNDGRYLYLHEQKPVQGWGAYVFDTQTNSELGLEVPAPLDELGTFDAGVGLFYGLNARSLAISGSSRQKKSVEMMADVLTSPQSFFQVFHRVVSRHNTVQLRWQQADSTASIADNGQASHTSLWIKERLPESLDLADMKKLFGHLSIQWQAPPFPNQQRDVSRYGFAELLLTQQDLRKLLASQVLLDPQAQVQTIPQTASIEGYLQEWVLNQKQAVAPKGSQAYQVPKPEELLFFDEHVLAPLLAVIRTAQHAPSVAYDDELQIVAQAAAVVGFQLFNYHDGEARQDYLVLTENPNKALRYWGTYVFRLGGGQPYILQIPRPLFEINSLEYGVDLFNRLQAQTLMIGAAHPYANSDGSSDLVNPGNKASVFNLVNEVLLREAREPDLMVVSTRAFAYRTDRPFPKADVVFALAEGMAGRAQLQALPKTLLAQLEKDGMEVQLLDGSEPTSGYEPTGLAQTSYLAATTGKQLAVLWLSPKARAGYRQQNENGLQAAHFNGLEIPSLEQDVGVYLGQQAAFRANTQLPDDLRHLLAQYLAEQDVLRLQQALGRSRALGFQWARLLDRNSKQAFLVVKDAHNRPFAVVNLAARTQETTYIDPALPIAGQVTEFINQRKTWLLRQAD